MGALVPGWKTLDQTRMEILSHHGISLLQYRFIVFAQNFGVRKLENFGGCRDTFDLPECEEPLSRK